jgi:5-methylcytosine-specific restriction endonuclease McrA
MSNLEVHHQQFRSHSGADVEDNLITLCSPCHAAAHRRKDPKKSKPRDLLANTTWVAASGAFSEADL